VPLDYDPLLSKLIVWAPNRNLAIGRMERALDEYFVGGIKTNLALFRRILRDPGFRRGDIHTGYLDQILVSEGSPPANRAEIGGEKIAAIAAALFAATRNSSSNGTRAGVAQAPSAWKLAARREGVRD